MLTEKVRFEIGDRLRDFRLSKGLTQQQFSERYDLSETTISLIENGKGVLSTETLYRICSEHEISSDFILFGSDCEPDFKDTLLKNASQMTPEKLETVIDYLIALKDMKNITPRN